MNPARTRRRSPATFGALAVGTGAFPWWTAAVRVRLATLARRLDPSGE